MAEAKAPTLEIEEAETDVLVLGGGIAGHRAAVAAGEKGLRVAMAYIGHGASPFIIGINVPLGGGEIQDSSEAYFDDMVKGGYHLNDHRLVRVLTTQAIDALHELETLGVPFERAGDEYLRRHLSGSTYPRSVYTREAVGKVILDHLAVRCRELRAQVWSGWKVVALMKDNAEVVGAVLLRPSQEKLIAVRARAVVLTMGGIGRIYEDSTYPADIAADSYALALDAGARLIDMEFVQFEPLVTLLQDEENGANMELPTGMLGDGAHLLNAQGERFMFRYNPEHGEKQIEKARLSLCIQKEIDEGRGFPGNTVLMDTTVVSSDRLESYVSQVKRLRAAGVDPAREMPHVRPATHSQMGGVFIDENCWSQVPGLYAAGEAAGGVHGASRLAGNGGSDAVVFGAVAGCAASEGLLAHGDRDWRRIQSEAVEPLRAATGRQGEMTPEEVKATVRRVMIQCAGLYRERDGLAAGIGELEQLRRNVEQGLRAGDLNAASRALEARNMVAAGRIIATAALTRCESRGAHQRLDHPHQDEEHWRKHVAFQGNSQGELVPEFIPIH